MSVLERTEAQEISVAEIDRIELARFCRRVVSDPQLRQQLIAEPAATIDASDVTLSPAAREALIGAADQLAGLTRDIDNPTAVAFFLIIVVK